MQFSDAIFIVCQLKEIYLIKKKDLWMAFVDSEKSFDRVSCEVVVWWALWYVWCGWMDSVSKKGHVWEFYNDGKSEISEWERKQGFQARTHSRYSELPRCKWLLGSPSDQKLLFITFLKEKSVPSTSLEPRVVWTALEPHLSAYKHWIKPYTTHYFF